LNNLLNIFFKKGVLCEGVKEGGEGFGFPTMNCNVYLYKGICSATTCNDIRASKLVPFVYIYTVASPSHGGCIITTEPLNFMEVSNKYDVTRSQ